jgi:addiction module HigA family antidote
VLAIGVGDHPFSEGGAYIAEAPGLCENTLPIIAQGKDSRKGKGLSYAEEGRYLLDHLGCDVKVVNRIVNNKTSISAEMAIKLSSTFGTSPEFWLNAQQALDIYRAKKRIRKTPEPLIRIG